jgi:hypothetical protein
LAERLLRLCFRDTKEAKKRNHLAHKITELERKDRRQYYKIYGHKLSTFVAVAKDGMGGWDEGGFDANDSRDAGDESHQR